MWMDGIRDEKFHSEIYKKIFLEKYKTFSRVFS